MNSHNNLKLRMVLSGSIIFGFYTRNPSAMARELEKISGDNYGDQEPNSSVNALCIFGMSKSNIFSTHPPTEKRIERLRGYSESV